MVNFIINLFHLFFLLYIFIHYFQKKYFQVLLIIPVPLAVLDLIVFASLEIIPIFKVSLIFFILSFFYFLLFLIFFFLDFTSISCQNCIRDRYVLVNSRRILRRVDTYDPLLSVAENINRLIDAYKYMQNNRNNWMNYVINSNRS